MNQMRKRDSKSQIKNGLDQFSKFFSILANKHLRCGQRDSTEVVLALHAQLVRVQITALEIFFRKKLIGHRFMGFLGRGCGAVGKAVASETRDPQIESQHRQHFSNLIVN